MKKRVFLHSILLCCFLLSVFSLGAAAKNTDSSAGADDIDMMSFYADEESGDGVDGEITLPIHNGFRPAAVDGNLVVVIDPGHGGSDSGAVGNGAYERNLNLAVSKYCKAYLEENYGNVTVYLTRPDNSTYYSLTQRAAIAASYDADIMLSFHFNSASSSGANGVEVYVSRLDEYAMTELAQGILNNLGELGIRKIGVKTRTSETHTLWRDGKRLADYYGIIKHPAKLEIPSMIVEHCFISSASDYSRFADSEEKLKKLGEADAKAIAAYFRLGQNTGASSLESKKADALTQMREAFLSVNLGKYSAGVQSMLTDIYQTAEARISAANNVGKIDQNLNRVLKTLANYDQIPSTATKFADVKTTNWFCDAVIYTNDKGLFFGTSAVTFSPQQAITRGMFISVIGRMAGADSVTPAETPFSDVSPSKYYAPFIKWGAEQNIVSGMGDNQYAPDQEIRREDLMRILHNYCVSTGIELADASEKTIADFNDSDRVDAWGIDGMNWGIQKGILHGDNYGNLNPRDNATRAEVAQIMMNFCKSAGK
ncbi:MAG: N-acetylmuramoyl-L-alanine amidase [Bacillota bacterium]|jgi:N-acetylmuramoyl-L-alanine amidase